MALLIICSFRFDFNLLGYRRMGACESKGTKIKGKAKRHGLILKPNDLPLPE